ncbi:hypothetical protein HYN59_06015 [Flavobacterium album]|uniref:Uncharacterized protein n=1 Tax=Flavobacterium album TaxID=2175091 RepID=A0A2S1QWA5_9FLAO|nr:hypothetical protein [Flavobacterium album]AWH84702.1 hypothetical protein HYN59_06015 [Flavobacterium album]
MKKGRKYVLGVPAPLLFAVRLCFANSAFNLGSALSASCPAFGGRQAQQDIASILHAVVNIVFYVI